MDTSTETIRKIRPLIAPEMIESQDPPAERHYWNYCVNCGTPLDSRKCKLFCPRCGFYHSCSEP